MPEASSAWFLKPTGEALRSAYKKGHAATSVLLAERWLRDHPEDLKAIHYYAEMLYMLERYEEAIAVYTDAIERFEDAHWGLYNQVGHLYRRRGDFAISELWYQKAIAANPEEAQSYVFLGAAQALQGKLKEAEETYRRATQCPEGWIDEAYCKLALVLRSQGRFAEAARCLRKALEIDPKYAHAREVLEDVEGALALLADDVQVGADGS